MSKQNNDENTTLANKFSASSYLPDLSKIRTYYDETGADYRLIGRTHHTGAIHFGYWDENTRSHCESLMNINRVLASHIGVGSGQRILDAGCGIGGSAIWLAKTFDVEVVGITPVASQVAFARRLAQEQGIADRVSFEQQDYTCTTFSSASFDVVWAMESICHTPNKRFFLAEAQRLLRPNGRLGIVEYMLPSRSYTQVEADLLQSWLSGWAIPNLSIAHQFLQWAQEEDFQDIQLLDITRTVKPSLRRLYRLALLSKPVAFTLRATKLRSETQQGNFKGALNQYHALQQGLWVYALLTATATSGNS